VNTKIRLEEADQTTVIVIDGGCAAVLTYADRHAEDAESPDAVILLDADGLERHAQALFRARIEMERESMGEFLRIVTNGFGSDLP
jgi:hypothetical protein